MEFVELESIERCYAGEPTHVVVLVLPSPSERRIRLVGVDVLARRIAFAIDAPADARSVVERRLRDEHPHAIRVVWDVSFLGWDHEPDPDNGWDGDRVPGGDPIRFAANLYTASRLGAGGQAAIAEWLRSST